MESIILKNVSSFVFDALPIVSADLSQVRRVEVRRAVDKTV